MISIHKKIAVFILFACLLFSVSLPAYAESNVEYNNAQEFVFNPTDKDLFQDFKEMMPGDTREQKIVLINTRQNFLVSVFLRAEIAEQYKEFLNYIDISVSYSTDADKTQKAIEIFSGLASNTGALDVDYKLADLSPNEKVYITVRLYMHKEMTNRFENATALIKWIFSAEEIKEITTAPSSTTVSTTKTTTNKTTSQSTSATTTVRTSTSCSTAIHTTKFRTTTTQKHSSSEKSRGGGKLPYTGSAKSGVIAMTALGIGIATIIINKKGSVKNNET